MNMQHDIRRRTQSHQEDLLLIKNGALLGDADRCERIIANLVKKARESGPFCEPLYITPEMAKLLLSKNKGNRKLKMLIVNNIANDIKDGRWELNGETIVISINGEVNDGQHRLNAIIVSDTPVCSFVSFGVERETRLTVDSVQSTKTPGDFVSMEDIDSGNLVASVAAYLIQVEQFGSIPNDAHQSARRPSKPQIIEYAKAHREDIKKAISVVPAKNSSRIGSHSLLIVSYIVIGRLAKRRDRDPETFVEDFIKSLLAGGKGEGDPIFAVRELMLEDKRRKRFTPRRAVELVLRAWNAHRGGRTLQKAVGTGQWPIIER